MKKLSTIDAPTIVATPKQATHNPVAATPKDAPNVRSVNPKPDMAPPAIDTLDPTVLNISA